MAAKTVSIICTRQSGTQKCGVGNRAPWRMSRVYFHVKIAERDFSALKYSNCKHTIDINIRIFLKTVYLCESNSQIYKFPNILTYSPSYRATIIWSLWSFRVTQFHLQNRSNRSYRLSMSWLGNFLFIVQHLNRWSNLLKKNKLYTTQTTLQSSKCTLCY